MESEKHETYNLTKKKDVDRFLKKLKNNHGMVVKQEEVDCIVIEVLKPYWCNKCRKIVFEYEIDPEDGTHLRCGHTVKRIY